MTIGEVGPGLSNRAIAAAEQMFTPSFRKSSLAKEFMLTFSFTGGVEGALGTFLRFLLVIEYPYGNGRVRYQSMTVSA